MLHIDQKPIVKRLLVSIPLFALGIGIAFIDFDVIWRYFAWSNQALSVLTLWMITAWFMRRRSRAYLVSIIPAMIMTYICSSFVFVSDQFVGMGACDMVYIYGGAVTAIISGLMILKIRRDIKHGAEI
jgi:carbon starvation protein CstA